MSDEIRNEEEVLKEAERFRNERKTQNLAQPAPGFEKAVAGKAAESEPPEEPPAEETPTEDPPAAAEAPVEGEQKAEGEESTEPEEPEDTSPEGWRRWREKHASRNDLRTELERERAEKQKLLDELIARETAPKPEETPAPQAPGPAPDPNEDPDGWLKHRLDEALSPITERLAPLVEQVQAQGEAAQSEAVTRAQNAMQDQLAAEVLAYNDTPEGAGYVDRARAWTEASVEKYIALGSTPQEALQRTNMDMVQAGKKAAELNVQLVPFFDREVLRPFAAGRPALSTPPATPPENQDPPVEQKVEEEVERLRRAAGAGDAHSAGGFVKSEQVARTGADLTKSPDGQVTDDFRSLVEEKVRTKGLRYTEAIREVQREVRSA